ncbi:MAG: hypothetical protein LBH34_00870 [Prevotellaceae bacterium]|nr:hypothetical protein [Prevotellaceae bacterium]
MSKIPAAVPYTMDTESCFLVMFVFRKLFFRINPMVGIMSAIAVVTSGVYAQR